MTGTIAILTVEILIPNKTGYHREPITQLVYRALQIGIKELGRDWQIRTLSLEDNNIGDDEI